MSNFERIDAVIADCEADLARFGAVSPSKIKGLRGAIMEAEDQMLAARTNAVDGNESDEDFHRKVALNAKGKRLYELAANAQGALDAKRGELGTLPSSGGGSSGGFSEGDFPGAPDDAAPIITGANVGARRLSAMFAREGLSSGGFRSLREFMSTVHTGRVDPRLQAAVFADDSTGTSSAGVMVPSGFIAQLLDMALELEIVRPRADVVPMVGPTATAPFWDTFDHTTNIGGLMGEWLYEGKPPAKKQNAKFSSLKLSAKKLGIFCDATNELLDDASSFGSALERAMILSVAWYNDWTYLNGDGVGKPLGVLNCPSLVKVQKDAGQVTPITYSNLARMFARMHPACMQNAVWVVNTSAIPQLLMTFPNDGAGNGGTQPILKEDGKGGYTMFTRPVLFTEKLPAVGSMGDVLFADFSQYVIGLRKEGTIERSSAVGWETDTTAYRLITRGDGFGKWPKAVTPKNGDSLSWAIALEARS